MQRYLIVLIILAPIICLAQSVSENSPVIQYQWITGQRDTIPTWVLESQGEGRYIGISDPCLDSIQGTKQAILRGWFLSLMDKSKTDINIIQEGYEQTKRVAITDFSTNKFMQFARFSTEICDTKLRKGRSYTSIFGEQFIELFVVPDNYEPASLNEVYEFGMDNDSKIIGEYVMHGVERSVISGQIRSELILNAICNNANHSTNFLIAGTRESDKLYRDINNIVIPNKERGRFWYTNVEIYQISEDKLSKCCYPLTDGIWRALYETMTYAIVNEPNYEYTIKSLNQGGDIKQNNSLIKSIYSGKISISLNGFRIKDNQILADWNIDL